MTARNVPASLDLRSDAETEQASFTGAWIVQVVSGDPMADDATVAELHPATVVVTDQRVIGMVGDTEWSWLLSELDSVVHGRHGGWSVLSVPGVADHGVSVGAADVTAFRRLVDDGRGHDGLTTVDHVDDRGSEVVASTHDAAAPSAIDPTEILDLGSDLAAPVRVAPEVRATTVGVNHALGLTGLEAREISAWFGTHHVLDRVSLDMRAGEVTALIGPSGCGKSTFLRILNRMHEMIPSASLSGEVLLDGTDIYDIGRRLTDARRQIGMVFQKPNPFPAMSIYDNVVASFRLTGLKVSQDDKDQAVESCLMKAGLWTEVRDRLRQPGGGLSGGQQQRLCIARALAIRPRVLLMDEPCSALDPTSTRRIEQTITELADEVTIVIVTHNMQQAARVSHRCAFFLAEQGTPGVIVEYGPTEAMFGSPQDPRTNDYVNGRFG